MRLIDADALENQNICDYCEKNNHCYELECFNWYEEETVRKMIKQAPTIEAVPVVRGEWIPINQQDDNGNDYYYCSICGKGELHEASTIVNYCWNCGAYMRGEDRCD